MDYHFLRNLLLVMLNFNCWSSADFESISSHRAPGTTKFHTKITSSNRSLNPFVHYGKLVQTMFLYFSSFFSFFLYDLKWSRWESPFQASAYFFSVVFELYAFTLLCKFLRLYFPKYKAVKLAKNFARSTSSHEIFSSVKFARIPGRSSTIQDHKLPSRSGKPYELRLSWRMPTSKDRDPLNDLIHHSRINVRNS